MQHAQEVRNELQCACLAAQQRQRGDRTEVLKHQRLIGGGGFGVFTLCRKIRREQSTVLIAIHERFLVPHFFCCLHPKQIVFFEELPLIASNYFYLQQ